MKLSNYKELISRSQARKVLAGLDRFNHLVFDFDKVSGIGQAYADEIFRVFPKMNPKVKVDYCNAGEAVEFMIKRAMRSK